MSGRLVDDELPPVLSMGAVDGGSHLALKARKSSAKPLELVLERKDTLHAGKVEPELGRQPLDPAQALEIGL